MLSPFFETFAPLGEQNIILNVPHKTNTRCTANLQLETKNLLSGKQYSLHWFDRLVQSSDVKLNRNVIAFTSFLLFTMFSSNILSHFIVVGGTNL